MNFLDFIKKGQVRKASPDISLVKSLYKNTLKDLKYLRTQKIDDLSSRKILTNYYDCLRSILEAIASLEGYKIYEHEAFKFFLEEIGEKINAIKYDRFRKIRNKINYYGGEITIEEAREISGKIKELTEYFINKYLKEKN